MSPDAYAIRIVYIGHDSVLPGEPVTTYYSRSGGELPFIKNGEQPASFPCKEDAMRTAENLRIRLQTVRQKTKTIDELKASFKMGPTRLKREYFVRVVVWNRNKFLHDEEINEQLMSTNHKKFRASEKMSAIANACLAKIRGDSNYIGNEEIDKC